jgi:hypothetical protein
MTENLLEALETSAREGAIVLQGEGVIVGEGKGRAVVLQFDALHEGGSYVMVDGERKAVTREKLVEAAAAGSFVGTITGRHGVNDDYDHPQPALWTGGRCRRRAASSASPAFTGTTGR